MSDAEECFAYSRPASDVTLEDQRHTMQTQ